jgi:hypothetical protein
MAVAMTDDAASAEKVDCQLNASWRGRQWNEGEVGVSEVFQIRPRMATMAHLEDANGELKKTS